MFDMMKLHTKLHWACNCKTVKHTQTRRTQQDEVTNRGRCTELFDNDVSQSMK